MRADAGAETIDQGCPLLKLRNLTLNIQEPLNELVIRSR